MKPLKLALFLCVSLLAIINMGAATPARAWTQMPTGAPAIPPAGFLGFCAKHLPECLTRSQEATTIELTDAVLGHRYRLRPISVYVGDGAQRPARHFGGSPHQGNLRFAE